MKHTNHPTPPSPSPPHSLPPTRTFTQFQAKLFGLTDGHLPCSARILRKRLTCRCQRRLFLSHVIDVLFVSAPSSPLWTGPHPELTVAAAVLVLLVIVIISLIVLVVIWKQVFAAHSPFVAPCFTISRSSDVGGSNVEIVEKKEKKE